MKKTLLLSIVLCLVCLLPAGGRRGNILKDFVPMCDSLSVFMQKRTSVKSQLKLKTVIVLDTNKLDFYFTESLGDLPLKKKDCEAFRNELKNRLPKAYADYTVGGIYTNKIPFEDLVTPELHNNGKPHKSAFTVSDHRPLHSFVEEVGGQKFHKGLSGRYIALWQSHGRYYDENKQLWQWQRARFFRTVEDMFTQSFVLPYLIPMLENAGAYTMTPRERDTQINEVITDNDPAFKDPRTGLVRKSGKYKETHGWTDAGTGFADSLICYRSNQNPFTMGTARQARCTDNPKKTVRATWTPDIPERGLYAVYISYKTLPKSTTCAHYTVKHLAGTTEFIVNQRIGGGTWIYVGTFEFEKGEEGRVTVDNLTPEGRNFDPGSIVTADAVKIGGGMGKIARGPKDFSDSALAISGMPAYLEGALYWMQWAGADSTLTEKFDNEYTKDFAGRGAWTSMMSGGSRVNPKEPGKHIPFDLSLAFHSDAGISPGDSTIGTLAIYTSKCQGKGVFPNGESRMAGREYCDYVQTQLVNDIRATIEPEWSRRQLWDRSYSESRTTSVPAMILELLSHQNFADMKYGLDPDFRFTASRAVYKGILKFLSNRYGCAYEVQPLPVNSFSAILEQDGTAVRLGWKETVDSLEQTAVAKGFILHTRIDDGAFDKGTILNDYKLENGEYHIDLPIEKGHIYSYRIVAFNEGGKSFPSETLCAGIPEEVNGKKILIVNNFDRVAAPAWFDTPEYAGFDSMLDGGVPYMNDISFAGNMYQFRRDLVWETDENPGFGASFGDYEGKRIAGNTFDYPYTHGKALFAAGYPFSSTSTLAFQRDTTLTSDIWAADIICGKQVSTITGRGAKGIKYQVFPVELQQVLTGFAARGGNILVSGANIGTDVWDRVYPITPDSVYVTDTKDFIRKTFGFKRLTNYASRSGKVWIIRNRHINTSMLAGKLCFRTMPNENIYCVETPDGLVPATDKAYTFLRYTDTNISAGICYDSGRHKAVSLGFPIETVTSDFDIERILMTALAYFEESR